MNVYYFHLNNQIYRVECIMLQIKIIQQEFLDKLNLKGKTYNGYISSQVPKGMYVLPQAGKIAHDSVVQHLEPYGYRP